ncbi:hypothetical protein Y032_0299g1773 [Ancylostoma ceylanicum]|uniref:Uncharacterized protein n=1 Tax=Ancylostoma ceylanicum TaxID=53326 RepID=A0A016S3X5_9BILA|nr:hypothetical protein Y032_0299g1773 [Ancylostoma ceylanicum]
MTCFTATLSLRPFTTKTCHATVPTPTTIQRKPCDEISELVTISQTIPGRNPGKYRLQRAGARVGTSVRSFPPDNYRGSGRYKAAKMGLFIPIGPKSIRV